MTAAHMGSTLAKMVEMLLVRIEGEGIRPYRAPSFRRLRAVRVDRVSPRD